MSRCRNVVAPARRWPTACARSRPGVGHCCGRARRAGGAGEDTAGDQLQERGGASQAPGSSWCPPSMWCLPLRRPRAAPAALAWYRPERAAAGTAWRRPGAVQQHAHAVDLVLATTAAARGAPVAPARIRPEIRCRNVVAPAGRRAAAGACRRRGAGHRCCRARRAGGAGEDPAADQLQERGGAGQAPGSSWCAPST